MAPRSKSKKAEAPGATAAPSVDLKGKGKASEEDAASSTAGTAESSSNEVAASGKMSMADRMAKMRELSGKMAATSRANMKDLIREQKKAKEPTVKKDASNSRKLAKAEKLLDERDMLERGEDVERNRNWQYSIEDSENWEEKLEKKEDIRDKGAVDFETTAERVYNRQVRELKPNVAAYRASKADSYVGPTSGASSALIPTGNAEGQLISKGGLEAAYSHLSYGDHKPSDADVDRLVGHLNMEHAQRQKRSRKRDEDPDEQVTYINEANKRYNKKVSRFYDKYTKEIRENFERGTAL